MTLRPGDTELEHDEEVARKLDSEQAKLVDRAIRLVRLEAYIGIYLPSPVAIEEEPSPD